MTHELGASDIGFTRETDDTAAMHAALAFCASCPCGETHVVKLPGGTAVIPAR